MLQMHETTTQTYKGDEKKVVLCILHWRHLHIHFTASPVVSVVSSGGQSQVPG
jgi:hypothetical protein